MKIPMRSAETLLVVLDDDDDGGGGGGGGSSSSSSSSSSKQQAAATYRWKFSVASSFVNIRFFVQQLMAVAVAYDQDTSHRKQVSDDNVGLNFLIKK